MTDTYDCIVIGAGQGGVPLAVAMANAGRRTAVVEREYVGGTCINTGCTPTKTMLASARVAQLTRRAAEFGVHVGGPIAVDLNAVIRRRQVIVERFRAGIQKRLEGAPGLDLLRGEARFLDRHTLEVTLHAGGVRQIRSDLIILDTGTRAILPHMRERRAGHLIYISSISAHAADASGASYQAAKRGVCGLAHAVRVEEKQHGIRTSVILPGLCKTDLVHRRPVPTPPEILDFALEPEDVADAVLAVARLHPRATVPEMELMPTRP